MNFSYWELKNWFTDIDYTVVGSGIVGLNCALALREKFPESKILILEKGILPQGASTKNAGFACFGSISEIIDDLKSHSEEEVTQLISKRWISHKMKNLSVDHALASGAIPGIFRAVELEDEHGMKLWHNDGGVVMNTPISPAIQAGADKVLVIYMGNPEVPPAELIPNRLAMEERT